MIKLGSKVKDMITNFEGIAIARCVYLNGCVRIQVQAKGLQDSKIIESEWIDEGQLVCKDKVKADVTKTTEDKEEIPGGPSSVPSKISHP